MMLLIRDSYGLKLREDNSLNKGVDAVANRDYDSGEQKQHRYFDSC